MKIKELIEAIEEALFEAKESAIYLYEMSLPHGKVMDKVRDLSVPIFEHTMKIILYGIEEEQSLHHWCHELTNWLAQCVESKIKRKGKDSFPNAKELYKWLLDYFSDESDVEGKRRVVEHEYTYQGHEVRKCTDAEIYNNIVAFYKEICPIVALKKLDDYLTEEIISKYRLG